MPTLVIANKLYSSWSLRPWLLLTASRHSVRGDRHPPRPAGHQGAILKHSPAGKVPILIDGDVTVWESLAIMEYVAERFGAAGLAAGSQGPRAWRARSRPRCMRASRALRTACPMNLGKKFRRPRPRRGGRAGRRALRGDRGARRASASAQRRAVPVRRLHGGRRHVRAGRRRASRPIRSRSRPTSRAYMDAILSLPPSTNGAQPPSRRPGSSPTTRSTSSRSTVYRKAA